MPTGKIDRVMAFGGLVFSSKDFFEMIYWLVYYYLLFLFLLYTYSIFFKYNRMENVYCSLLSEESLVVHSSFLLD